MQTEIYISFISGKITKAISLMLFLAMKERILLPFGVYSDKIITFAIRMDGTAVPLSCYIVG